MQATKSWKIAKTVKEKQFSAGKKLTLEKFLLCLLISVQINLCAYKASKNKVRQHCLGLIFLEII